jgi:phosphoribosyl 1,2-cyclic phosphodiesterase
VSLRIRFWGTRGSLPVAMSTREVQDKLARALLAASGRTFASLEEARAFAQAELEPAVSQTFGGNTSCVELETESDEYYVCDMGSGARSFGSHILAQQGRRPPTVNIFMSHLHWDHIMGFPFFGPAYVPGAKIRIHSCHDVCEHAFRLQQQPPCFPVDFDYLSATIEFVKLETDRPNDVGGGLTVTPRLQLHAGDSYGFRFEKDGKSVVYTTDSEHKLENFAESAGFVEFLRGADVVIFDAMYSMIEAISVKADWGHSSNVVGVELCQMAGVKHLVLFHHEPANDDATLLRLLRDAQRLEQLTRTGAPLEVTSARDGVEIEL